MGKAGVDASKLKPKKVLVLWLGTCESSECPAPAQPRFHALRLP